MHLWSSFIGASSLLFTDSAVSALNITVYHNESFAPVPLTQSHADSDGGQIISLFQDLGRTTVFKLFEKVTFEGNLWEPEGIARLSDDRYVVSAGEYTAPTVKYNQTTNGTDRSAGAGFAHLVVFSGNGTRIADATLTTPGATEYHNGGLDYDGQYIWATIAQYRPNTTATVNRIDPYTLQPTPILHAADHLGGILHDVQTTTLYTLDWGSRNTTTWNTTLLPPLTQTATPLTTTRNPSYFIDYQDCKFLGNHPIPSTMHPSTSQPTVSLPRHLALCSGVTSLTLSTSTSTTNSSSPTYNLGGLAIVDLPTMTPIMEIPITLTSDRGTAMTQNPMDVSVDPNTGLLRFYFLPDQGVGSILYVYEAQRDSPYEY